jgi:hypothetical protein
MNISILMWADYLSSKGAHSHSRSTDAFLHPQNLAGFTDEVYAPKRRTDFTAHIKQFNGLAILSGFHISCMSNVLILVSLWL